MPFTFDLKCHSHDDRIYKDKYNDDNTSTSDSRSVRSGRSMKKDNSEKKARDKSRTRTIFGRKKSHTASST